MIMPRHLASLLVLALGATMAARAPTASAQTPAAPASQLVASARPTGSDDARDEAIEKLTSFLSRYPASTLRPGALFQLGELLVRRADENFATAQRAGGDVPDRPEYGPAIARYEELIQKFPAYPRIDAAAYTLGTLYFTQQRNADAVRMFELVTSKDQSHFRPEGFFRLGDADFELAAKLRGEPRKAMFVRAAQAYENATKIAPPTGDIYFLSLYKLGWSYYNQATQSNQPEYQQAVEVFGRLVAEYDKLSPEQQARLGLRGEAIEYMAVALTQTGGAEAARRYFGTHRASGFKLPVLRRVASGLRDQGDFVRAVDAYRAVLAESPADSSALGVQREIVDIYQNRVLEPDKAQAARLELVDRFAPGSVWANANAPLKDSAQAARESALRQSAQYSLSRAQEKKDRAKFAEAADLYGRYMTEFSKSDSAQAVDLLYGEALFAEGEYFKAGTEYSRAAYSYKNDPKLSAQAGQDAIVAFDSATVRAKGDRAAQDSLFAVVDRYVAAFPSTDVSHHALIEKGKRASEAQRWDVMAATFKTYADNYPNDPYTPTAQKLIGDALYKQGLYTEAQGQWENAQAIAIKSGKKALSDTITLVRNAAAVTYGDSLVKAGNYREAAEAVYVAFADRNPTSDRAPDALRNAIETYVLADSVARVKGDTNASTASKQRALELSQRLVTSYPTYKYRVQYQALQTQLLADLGKRDEAAAALETLIHENPTWPGRADAMVRLAVDYDSLGKPAEEAAAYEHFAAAYPKDARAADAQYNAGVSYLQGADTAGAIRAYGSFAAAHPRDPRVGSAQATRVALIKAGGNVAAANVELAKLCARPTAEIKTQCAARAGENEFAQGRALFPRYQALKLIIPLRVNLTRAGVERLSAPKRKMLADMSTHFTKAIASGDPTWLSAASYYVGLAQWEYGNYLANLTLPKDLSDEQRAAAQAGSARQAEQYYQAANKLWQTLVDKAATDKFDNPWVQRAKDAIGGKVDASPPAASLGHDAGRVGGAS
ncbi:MAG TPA: tetratricopeptide repeat protein [Gemmatimonadaceae bacterium]